MFTGLVEESAPVLNFVPTPGGAILNVAARHVLEGTQIGDSIAVNGCCLTVTAVEPHLSFDLLAETRARTNLDTLQPGDRVNLERALPANGRLGGHFVQGHIDTTSEILSIEPHGDDHRLEIALPEAFAHYAVFKGSIAVNGISLTLAEVTPASLVIWIIPHTLRATNLGALKAGDRVNLEFDLLAKYMERLLQKK